MGLVIGIGNPLRRDDGVGRWLADRVAEWNLPGVTVRGVHQLTPELAAEVAEHEQVLFLDAAVSEESSGLFEIAPATASAGWGHEFGPAEILALAEVISPLPRYSGGEGPGVRGSNPRDAEVGSKKRTWMLAVHGTDFRVGEGLSEATLHAGERALVEIRNLLCGGHPAIRSM